MVDAVVVCETFQEPAFEFPCRYGVCYRLRFRSRRNTPRNRACDKKSINFAGVDRPVPTNVGTVDQDSSVIELFSRDP